MAKDDQIERLTGAVAKTIMKFAEAEKWKALMKQLGLIDEEMVERLVKLLLIHLVMDRTITAVLTVKLVKDKPTAFGEVENELVRINLSSRIRLVKACAAISDSCAKDMHEVNNVRNQFSHYDPKLQGGLAAVKQIASEQECGKFIQRAIGAIEELGKAIGLPSKQS